MRKHIVLAIALCLISVMGFGQTGVDSVAIGIYPVSKPQGKQIFHEIYSIETYTGLDLKQHTDTSYIDYILDTVPEVIFYIDTATYESTGYFEGDHKPIRINRSNNIRFMNGYRVCKREYYHPNISSQDYNCYYLDNRKKPLGKSIIRLFIGMYK